MIVLENHTCQQLTHFLVNVSQNKLRHLKLPGLTVLVLTVLLIRRIRTITFTITSPRIRNALLQRTTLELSRYKISTGFQAHLFCMLRVLDTNVEAFTNQCWHSSVTYLLTPRSRVLLEKLTGSAASQEIPRIFGTRRFITVLASARHLSLSWATLKCTFSKLPHIWHVSINVCI